jgi:LPXTG-site transpeptidase (sortase) family protein
MTAASCGSDVTNESTDESAVTEPKELIPAFSVEELKEEVDFVAAAENSEYITAESGEVTVATGQTKVPDDAASDITAVRSQSPPETVWSETPITYENDEFTLPDDVIMQDGSLGSLSIPAINLTVSIYETDDEIEAMAHGVAHMKETSCWAGNVGLAGHNSGVNTYFADIHKLSVGDEIKLTTALGGRTYIVTGSEEIGENDWSKFARSDSNIITLLTCVNHDGSKRLIVRGEEKT